MNRLFFLSRRSGDEPQGVAAERKQAAAKRPGSGSTRLATLLASLLLWSSHLPAQVAEAWTTQIPEGRGAPIDLYVQPTGHLQIFGWGGPTDSSTVRLDPNGVFLWSHGFDSNYTTLNTPIDQEVDNAGNVYVIRNSDLLFKYAGDGTLLWTKLLTDTNGGAMFASRLALDASGRVLVAGSTHGPGNESDFLILKCDTNGTVLWSSLFNGGLYDAPSLLAVDSAGNVHVAGTTTDATVGTDLVIVKYDGAGRQQWEARYDNPTHGSDFPVAVQVDASGNVYVSGFSFAGSHPNVSRVEVVKFDAAGRLLWTAHYSGAPNEFLQATAAGLDSSGNVVVAGMAYDVIDNAGDMVLVKFDPAGIRQWAARYNGPRRSTESARALALDSFGNAYVTGDSQEGTDPTNPDTTSFFTQKFDSAGNRLWGISHSSTPSFYNYPAGIGLDAVGNVYIAGSQYGPLENLGWLAVKYVQTPAPGLPTILSRPANQTVPPRSSVTFTVSASGNAPLSYQWRNNGRLISRATNATLILSNVQFAQRGGYSVDVSNAVGVVATAEAELIVLEPPSITRQPASQTVFLGTEAAFSVAVTGLEPFRYQWRHDGTDVPGATNATLTLLNVQSTDAGAYSVGVSNVAGSITSQPAVLTVSTQVMRSWAARYDGPAQVIELNPLLALDGAGLPLVAATSQGDFTDFDLATIKHNLAGTRLWASRFNSASNRADYATALFTDSAGNVYVAGHSLGGEQPALTVIKYDPAGQLLWSVATNAQWRTDLPCIITADTAGNAYVAASVTDQLVKAIIIKIAPNGRIAWSINFSGGFDYDQLPRAIAVDPSGNLCVGIREDYYCCADFLVVKYDPDGRELWRAAFDGDEGGDGAADALFGMGLDSTGNIYLGGVVEDYADGERLTRALAVVKFDGDGNRVWVGRHRSLANRRVTPVAFAVNSPGASWFAYVSAEDRGDEGGFSEGGDESNNSFDVVVHFGLDGQERWVSVPTTPGVGTLTRLAADNTGNGYFAGTAFRDASGNDLAASRIDSTGSLLWTALYNGPANGQDNGSGIVVNPAGDIFVVGTSTGPTGLPDVVLVKYHENTVPGLPAIASPLTNVFTRMGSDVTFTVTASGPAPLRYQWLFNGTPLPGGTNSSLTLRGVRPDQAGFYAVQLSNPAGTVRSAAARLELLPVPSIIQQPADRESVVGGDAYFSIRVKGVNPLTYQWLVNGVPIADATNATLLLQNLRADQTGIYSIRVTDAAGAVFSQPVRLVVSQAATKCEQWDYRAATSNAVGNTMITRDGAGNFYVAGAVWNTNDIDYLTLKYSPTGQLLWHAEDDLGIGGRDYPVAIAVDAAGNVYVTGVSYHPQDPFESDYATIKYDAQGQKVWARRYSGPGGTDYASGLVVDHSGNVCVTGGSNRSTNGNYASAYLTVKYGPDGSQLWTAEYRGPGQSDTASALSIDDAGNTYVTGYSAGVTFDGHFATIKYDPDGHQLWVARYEQVSGGATAMTLDHEGNVVIAGWSVPWATIGPGNEIVTVKYDNAGHQLWAAHEVDSTGVAYARRAVAVDAAGNVVVTGISGYDIATLKYTPDGQRLWAARYDGPLGGADVVRDLVLDAGGNAYITGFSPGLDHPDYLDAVTMKYNPAGTRLWLARKSRVSETSFDLGLVLDPTRNVYVVAATPEGVATLKYCQTEVPGGPMILEPPLSQDAMVGANVTFHVVANGESPLGYQWRLNSQPIWGATTSTLSLSNVQPANAGHYSVEVFNALGAVVSADARLGVHVPASIVGPPVDECVIAGSTARFGVTAEGEAPINYQWSFGGQDIPGATSATLLVSNVQPGQVGVYTVRASNPFGGATASASLSLLPNVQQLWARAFDNVNPPPFSVFDLDDWPTRSAMDPAGNLYIAGFSVVPAASAPSHTRDIFIVKYDANGTLQWVTHHGATNQADRRPTGIAATAAGEVYLAVEDYTDTNAPALLKYSASGQLLWTARFPGAGYPTPRDLALDSAGNAYVIELTYRVMKVSPTGTRLWTAFRQNAMALDVTADDMGNVYVAGAAFAPSGPQPSDRGLDYLTVKYNAAGVEQWSRTFRGPLGLENAAYAIAVDPAGNVIVTGSYVVWQTYLGSLNSRLNFGTFKYDPSGNVIWFANYGETNSADFPAAMAIDAAGNVFITGFSENYEGSGSRWVTLKYGAAGELQWTRGSGFEASAYEQPVGIALDGAGNAYVSGTLQEENFQPIITTVKYGTAGDEVWTAQFEESRFSEFNPGSFAVGVHVDANQRVRVAGRIGTHTHDVIALAYSSLPSSGAPVILIQPQSVTVPLGDQAQFSVIASNALRFQWQFNGRDLPGANDATLVLPAVDWTQEGYYAARIENDTYCVISRAVQLSLDVPAPVIIDRNITDYYFHGRIVGSPGQTYRIEASGDLASWTTVTTIYATERTFDFYDYAAPWQSRRFYRVVQEP